ncbi:MAG: hypothetical protein ACI957_002593, partial [Verrucomicrobiales bacterium]
MVLTACVPINCGTLGGDGLDRKMMRRMGKDRYALAGIPP